MSSVSLCLPRSVLSNQMNLYGISEDVWSICFIPRETYRVVSFINSSGVQKCNKSFQNIRCRSKTGIGFIFFSVVVTNNRFQHVMINEELPTFVRASTYSSTYRWRQHQLWCGKYQLLQELVFLQLGVESRSRLCCFVGLDILARSQVLLHQTNCNRFKEMVVHE